MAITEVKELESIEYLVSRSAINVLWKNKILRDGVVIHEENERRAMPLNEHGELSPEDEALLGAPLSDILGAAGGSAIVERDACEQQKTALQGQIESLQQTIEQLSQENADLRAQLESTNNE